MLSSRRLRLCITFCLFLIIAPFPLNSVWSQDGLIVDADWSCSFDGQDDHKIIFTFASTQQAQDAVARIVKYTGVTQNFTIAPNADIKNAKALIDNDRRLILYNPEFILRLVAETRTDWAATGVIAHEIGHHLQGHTNLKSEPGEGRPELELEADRYAGFILQRMGASLEQALSAWQNLPIYPTQTHPGRQKRLAAVTDGWTESKNLAPMERPPEVEPTPVRSQPNEIWFVTMSKTINYDQKYLTVDRLSSESIQKNWNSDYYITRIASGDSRWVVVMSKKTGFKDQKYITSDVFPDDSIEKNWDDGYDITTLGGNQGTWAVVMSKGSKYSSQSYIVSEDFPTKYINEKGDNGYYITDICAANGRYAVVMSKGVGFVNQSYDSNEEKIPVDWIRKKWDDGFDITSIVKKGKYWTVIMSKGANYKGQFYWLTREFPAQWIREKWKKGYDISILY